jgi:hypothetical protein
MLHIPDVATFHLWRSPRPRNGSHFEREREPEFSFNTPLPKGGLPGMYRTQFPKKKNKKSDRNKFSFSFPDKS